MTTPPTVVFPASVCMASVIMTMRTVVGVNPSPFTFEEQRQRWEGDQWMMECKIPPIKDRATAAEWQAFFLELQGMFGQFLMGDPSASIPRGVATGAPLVNGASQTGNALVIDGCTPNVNGWLKKGDYFQTGTGSSSRLYMMTADANTDAGGNTTLQFRGSLKNSPADNSAIVVNNPKGVFRLSSNDFSWSVAPGKIWTFPGFTAVEIPNA